MEWIKKSNTNNLLLPKSCVVGSYHCHCHCHGQGSELCIGKSQPKPKKK